MSKRIIVINGHPVKDSFSEAIANEYIKGAKESGAEIKFVNLYSVNFDPILKLTYKTKKQQEVEKELKRIQEDIKWADHIVFTFPIWWGDMPALMKGFFDRTFIAGFAFDPKNKTLGLPRGLLTNKSARLLINMGASVIIYKTILGERATKILKSTLNYCGIKPVKATHFGKMDACDETRRKEILKKVRKLGLNMQ